MISSEPNNREKTGGNSLETRAVGRATPGAAGATLRLRTDLVADNGEVWVGFATAPIATAL